MSTTNPRPLRRIGDLVSMLASGTRVGPYELLSPLGAGGMGEVYRAKDLKLGREVAIKILPELFASDPDRLARFQREAQLLASLNHPNIAAIYGLEDSEGTKALVLELVLGETLADRISPGPIPTGFRTIAFIPAPRGVHRETPCVGLSRSYLLPWCYQISRFPPSG